MAKTETHFWITSVGSSPSQSPDEAVTILIKGAKIFAFGNNNHARKRIKPDDQICFYAKGKGIVAHARVLTSPDNLRHTLVDGRKYPWLFELEGVSLYLNQPVIIDSALRHKLDAFGKHNPDGSWSWFLQSSKLVSQHDFKLLTRS